MFFLSLRRRRIRDSSISNSNSSSSSFLTTSSRMLLLSSCFFFFCYYVVVVVVVVDAFQILPVVAPVVLHERQNHLRGDDVDLNQQRRQRRQQRQQRQRRYGFASTTITTTTAVASSSLFDDESDGDNDNDEGSISSTVPTTATKTPPSSSNGTTTTPTTIIDTINGPYHYEQLNGYWCTEPLLIRNAFDVNDHVDNRNVWPTYNDIYNLATYNNDDEAYEYDDDGGGDEDDDDNYDDEFKFDTAPPSSSSSVGESARLIQHQPGKLDSFTVEFGPFPVGFEKEIEESERCWTLLVNDVDKYYNPPNLSKWMDREFGTFLPRWRRDDAMISIAPKGGGIGPHVDNYDVFLVQVSGTRSWKVGCCFDNNNYNNNNKLSTEDEMNYLIPNLSVRVLDNNNNGNEPNSINIQYVDLHLQPGDMLYLPPRIVHWGTALRDHCVTLSVGCRAPSGSELVARIAETMMATSSVKEKSNQRYTDANLITTGIDNNNNDAVSLSSSTTSTSFPSISDSVKKSMKRLVLEAVEEALDDDMAWDEIVGRLATEPKRYVDINIDDDDDDDELTPSEVMKRIEEEGRGFLYCTEAVATSVIETAKDSSSNHNNVIIYRLYINGDKYEVVHQRDDDDVDSNHFITAKIFQCIERGEAITGRVITEVCPKVRSLLENWISLGLLHYTNNIDDIER